jgi:hypothetical protein
MHSVTISGRFGREPETANLPSGIKNIAFKFSLSIVNYTSIYFNRRELWERRFLA